MTYPWDMENIMLEQHKQPCDCAICDDIHMARIGRRKRREQAENSDAATTIADLKEEILALKNALLKILVVADEDWDNGQAVANIARVALEI